MLSEEWVAEFDKELAAGYGITSADAGLDDDDLESLRASCPEAPVVAVGRFAEKYDLIPKDVWR